ncbi:MAG: LssY C-terminal domain-containing protein [Steroidobacteraceae bacterium]
MSLPSEPASPPRLQRHEIRRLLRMLLISIVLYLVLAYGALPAVWRLFEHRHPALSTVASRTVTGDGIPGDPLNVAFVGLGSEMQRRLLAAGWLPADPITMLSSLRIAGDSIVHRPYGTAPVSNLYLWGHRQDLAFEKMIGGDPRRRHHVRFWVSAERDDLGRELWIGAVTLDIAAGVSHRTGQVTHHIGADIDRERDQLLRDLQGVPAAPVQWIDGFQTDLRGRNGGGDVYTTDGRLPVVITVALPVPAPATATVPGS